MFISSGGDESRSGAARARRLAHGVDSATEGEVPQPKVMADHTTLARLLGPDMPPDVFLATIWDIAPWLRHVDAKESEGAGWLPFDGLLTLGDMDELLMRARLPGSQAELLIFENLKAISTYATPHMAFAFGASIIVNHTDKVWPPANALCAMLGQGFRYAFANLYFTPDNSQTAPPHSDDRDVFILQLHGKKHWRVWPTPHPMAVRRPFRDEQAGKPPLLEETDAPIDPDELGEPCIDTVLIPGSVLYIPRGCLHVADTTDGTAAGSECSLHLTIAIPTADLCLGGFIHNAVKAHCFGLRAFRQALPLGPLPDETYDPELAAETSGAASPTATLRAQAAAGGTSVRLHLRFKEGSAPATTASSPAASSVSAAPGADGSAIALHSDGAAASPTRPNLVGASNLVEQWRARHRELWAFVHREVRWNEAHDELCVRMENHRRTQREALEAVEQVLLEGRRRGVDEVAIVLPGTRMRKIVPLQMIRPSGELGGRRVAQASPRPGGPGKHKYIHTPPSLLVPLEAFAAMPLGCEFAVGELPAKHNFLRASAGRSLLSLGVATLC